MEEEEYNDRTPDQLKKITDQMDLLHSKKMGRLILESFEHDDFIDGLDKAIKYPKDAP